MATQYDWFVFSTALQDHVIMVECKKTGGFGIIRNPTKDEWGKAFYAPSNPYRWTGGNDRVEVQEMYNGKWVPVMDETIKEFISDKCIEADGAAVSMIDFYQTYCDWYVSHFSTVPLSHRRFSEEIYKRFERIISVKIKGIQLK